MSLLELRDVDVAYGDLPALRGVSLTVAEGEILSVVGANGAGKTTMLRTISGLLRPRGGEILFDGRRIDRLPSHAVVEGGVVQVPEGRKIFPSLTVRENLELGAYSRPARPHRAESLARVFALFPILAERGSQAAGTMSGGQQQMLAIGRALMARPRLLMLDEPSLGLAPMVVQEIFRTVAEINRAGTTVMLVEQNTRQALALAARGYVLENGRVVLVGPGSRAARQRARQARISGNVGEETRRRGDGHARSRDSRRTGDHPRRRGGVGHRGGGGAHRRGGGAGDLAHGVGARHRRHRQDRHAGRRGAARAPRALDHVASGPARRDPGPRGGHQGHGLRRHHHPRGLRLRAAGRRATSSP